MSAFWEEIVDLRDQDPAEVGRRLAKELVERARSDPGAAFEPEAIAALAALRRDNPAGFERVRNRLGKLGTRLGALDRHLAAAAPEADAGTNGQGRALELPQPEPWPEPVGGVALLDDIAAAFRRYLALPPSADVALALWTVHAHAFDAGQVTPRLAATSPEKRCGKTTLLAILGRLVPRPLPTANVTAAAVFRTIEAARPTLLIDEADTFLANSDELRGILNSGHSRGSAYVVRTVGDDHEPRQFSTWAPVALAAIGRLPGTLQDRAIAIAMRRRAPNEEVERLRLDRCDHLDALARRAARWVADHRAELAAADPPIPAELHDRAADNWRPLLAVADLAGGDWPGRARDAATAQVGDGEAVEESARVQLLADLRGLFEANEGDSLWSSEICDALARMEDRRWPEWKAGRPITPRQLASLLRPFGIAPDDVRRGEKVLKGYKPDQFKDAFSRYLPRSATLLRPSETAAFGGCRSATWGPPVADENGPRSAVLGDCSGVADRTITSGADRACAADRCWYCGDPELNRNGVPFAPLKRYGDPATGATLMHEACRNRWQRERQADGAGGR